MPLEHWKWLLFPINFATVIIVPNRNSLKDMILVSPDPVLSVWCLGCQAAALIGWKCESRRSEEVAKLSLWLRHPSAWTVLLPQCDQSVGCLSESPVNFDGRRLFTESASRSLCLKEDYKSIETLLEALECDEFGWEVIENLKMVASWRVFKRYYHVSLLPLLQGQQRGRTTTGGPAQWTEFFVERNNVKWEPLATGEPLKSAHALFMHMKLGHINTVTALGN